MTPVVGRSVSHEPPALCNLETGRYKGDLQRLDRCLSNLQLTGHMYSKTVMMVGQHFVDDNLTL